MFPDPRQSRAVLIGTSEFRDLPNLPAVRNNLADLRVSLTNNRHGILVGENCSTVENPRTPQDFMRSLREVTRRTNDFLLVYYAGHGLRHDTRDHLYLSLPETDTEALNGTAVPLDWVKEEIERSPARTRLLVLDCCYSGLAVGTMSTMLPDRRELEVRGSAVIASSPRNAKSHSPAGRRHTAFTERLVTLLDEGSPNAGEDLTVKTLFHRLDAALAADGFPRPKIAATDTASDLRLRKDDPPPAPVDPPTVRHLRPVAPPASRTPDLPPRDAKFWTQILLLRLLWVGFSLMTVMCLSGLSGLLFAEPSDPQDVSYLAIGGGLSATLGAPLFILRSRWRHLRGRTHFAGSTAGTVLLAMAGMLGVAIALAATFGSSSSRSTDGSAASADASMIILGLEGAAACGYFLYRGRRAPH